MRGVSALRPIATIFRRVLHHICTTAKCCGSFEVIFGRHPVVLLCNALGVIVASLLHAV